jgi:DNA (cytosine-5)-methyltransferase 1
MKLKYVDLFCGIGGFHVAADQCAARRGFDLECVLACDIDEPCRQVYQANYGLMPHGDINELNVNDIPPHDLLFAGFPCQPFSIIGGMRGFDDTRGTLFFEIARILRAHKPSAFVLENVKMLVGHQNGQTIGRIIEVLNELGYETSFRVLNALDFGLPQKRERVLIVGFSEPTGFIWPEGGVQMTPLSAILEDDIPAHFFASEKIRASRAQRHKKDLEPTIWHENKSGNVSKLPYASALRAGASHNYLLVNGERRLTEREMLRLQGFPDSFKPVYSYSTTRKQVGNSVPVPMIEAVINGVLDSISSVTSDATFVECHAEDRDVSIGPKSSTFANSNPAHTRISRF